MTGPLAPYAVGFQEELARLGYTPGSACRVLNLMAHVSRWLAGHKLGVEDLGSRQVGEFCRARREEGYANCLTPRALSPLITYLHHVGVVATTTASGPQTPVDELMTRFVDYLVTERGAAPATVRSYSRHAHMFLSRRQSPSGLELEELTAAHILEFLAAECPRLAPASAANLAKGLRCLLRFLHVEGVTPTGLVSSVPGAAGWRLASLPKAIDGAVVTRLLTSCDSQTVAGRRDLAVLTLLARFGLRVGEVAALDLADIDWRTGEVLVRGKGNRQDRLPLPADVGEAVVDWLRRRPACCCSRVITTVRAPLGPIGDRGVSAIVRRASLRCGLEPLGAHRLRHTVATELLQAGAGLGEIGLVLRHHRLSTTAVYAKVDRSRLASQDLADYLELRRSLGFKLERAGRLLHDFVTFVDHAGANTLTIELALRWATLSQDAQPSWLSLRLGMVRGFARYLHSLDQRTEVPPTGLLPFGYRRVAPHLYSEAEIAALMDVARSIRSPMRSATYECFIGLLAVTGLRVGEAMRLDCDDVNWSDALLSVRDTKFGKSREVALHASAVEALHSYADRRDRLCARRSSPSFFVSTAGTRLSHPVVQPAFQDLRREAGLDRPTALRPPRLTDLRHTFAVRTVIGWYRAGLDVAARMPLLSTYLGHGDPARTYWYLSASPELLALAAGRLETPRGEES